ISRGIQGRPPVRTGSIVAFACEVVNDLVGLRLGRLRQTGKKQKNGQKREKESEKTPCFNKAFSLMLQHCENPLVWTNRDMTVDLDNRLVLETGCRAYSTLSRKST